MKKAALLVLVNLCLCLSIQTNSIAQEVIKSPIILDADTGNEVDDFFALARALIEPSWEITCLNAAQWQSSQWAVPNTMENSHRLNQSILSELEMDIKTRRGGTNRMFDWGDMAQHSAATYEIIRQANDLPTGEKLTIVALGALTNLGSAIYIDPSIATKIKLYWLGTTYDFEKGILKRQDFNCMMDQQALEFILMSEVEMHVMPVNIALDLTFTSDEIKANFTKNNGLSMLLMDRWYEHIDGGRKMRVVWDLALIQAILFPEWTKQTTIVSSKDNGQRKIHYYSAIDASKMKTEFFRKLKSM